MGNMFSNNTPTQPQRRLQPHQRPIQQQQLTQQPIQQPAQPTQPIPPTPPPQRKFGNFQCTKCKKKWKSSHAWEGKTQSCTRCDIAVLPYSLQDIETTFEYTYICNNQKCKKVHKKPIVGLSENVFVVINKTYAVSCGKQDNRICNVRPNSLRILHNNNSSSVLCYGNCKDCQTKHMLLHTQDVVIRDMGVRCTFCNGVCMIHEISRLKPINSSVPHQQEFCEMCQQLKRYCGR